MPTLVNSVNFQNGAVVLLQNLLAALSALVKGSSASSLSILRLDLTVAKAFGSQVDCQHSHGSGETL